MPVICILCVITTARDEVDVKKKRSSDPMCTMTTYVDQSIKVRKLKQGLLDEVSTLLNVIYITVACIHLPASWLKCRSGLSLYSAVRLAGKLTHCTAFEL